MTSTLTPDIQERFRFSADKGAVVEQVMPGSPAAAAGLRPHDVITRIGDKEIESDVDLQTAVRAMAPGSRTEVHWMRGPEPQRATVTVAARPGGG